MEERKRSYCFTIEKKQIGWRASQERQKAQKEKWKRWINNLEKIWGAIQHWTTFRATKVTCSKVVWRSRWKNKIIERKRGSIWESLQLGSKWEWQNLDWEN